MSQDHVWEGNGSQQPISHYVSRGNGWQVYTINGENKRMVVSENCRIMGIVGQRAQPSQQRFAERQVRKGSEARRGG